ncbi:hypothetical protein H2204_002168 [Knufia peltigerae]|uniref:Uncharacterized protein n=1 Tax=Knufia peltigerae TaxID=1002370 RepID=A0AA39D1L1_9EURO|nr:hypothetical protein H2204_002168 [Knufia peltigerae]
MCFRDDIPDPTQQPIRITQSTEAHDSESYGDVAHLPRHHSTASTATAGGKRHSQSLAPALSHHSQYAHLSPSSTNTRPSNASDHHQHQHHHHQNAKELRQLKAKDPNVIGKVGVYTPNNMFAGSTVLT